MKSLYESILDMDDEKLDTSSQNIKDYEWNALSGGKYGLEVDKGPKGLTINHPVYLYRNGRGEPTIVLRTTKLGRRPKASADAPSIAEMFPDGVVLKNVCFYSYDNVYTGKLSDLPDNVVIEELELPNQDNLESIDRKVPTVVFHLETNSGYGTAKNMRMDWTKYVHTLVVTNDIDKYTNRTFYELMDMKNCPIKNVIILSGGVMFGLQTPDKPTAKIGDFKPDMDDPKQKESYGNFVENVKKWIKDNQKSNLIMNWKIQKDSILPIPQDWQKQILEQVTLNGDDLKFNTLSSSQKNNL